MKVIDATIEHHAHKDFIEAAVADGWTASEGPWGYAEGHERTVKLTKHFPELGGSVLVWMIHRNIGKMLWSKEASRWVNQYEDSGWFTQVEAWHKPATGGDKGLTVTLEDVLEHGLSEGFWVKLAHTCDNCGKVADHMNHVAFANKACDECVTGMRAKMERPGWAD
jgi:hypothetical protein